jgi:exosortase family protein XrtM
MRRSISLTARALAFLFAFATLQLIWQGLRGTAVERVVVQNGIVRPAAWLVNGLTPGVQVRAGEHALLAAGGGLNILNGCEGIEALFLLCAALLVAPGGARSRGLGMLLGTVLVFVLNQARILTLFYVFRADRALFGLLHGTVMPLVTVLLVCGYFHLWLAGGNRRAAPSC